MIPDLINLANQCCDADQYLDMGYQCARLGNCYNSLRPVGDTLWFSIPYVFHTSENIFFYLHLFLLGLVALTFFNLIRKQTTNTKTRLATCTFLLIVVVLVWPTFFHPLSDTPATLLFIEGILLVLTGFARNHPASYFAAGISLGLSALLRAAYFMPLSLAGILFFTYWLWQVLRPETRKVSSIFILSLLIPLSFQFFATWKHTGQWHFVSEARSHSLMNLHLQSADAGYDTQLPQTQVFWSPDCSPANGLLPSLKAADIPSVLCIFENRLEFYLGSYASHTYLGEPARNFIDNDYAEKIGSPAGWSSEGLHSELNSALSPLNDQTASRILIEKRDEVNKSIYAEHFIQSRSLLPLPAGNYRYSIWLWASSNNDPLIPEIYINAVEQHPITLTNKPQLYTFDISNTFTGYITTRINISGDGKFFNVWGAALEPAETAKNYSREPQKITKLIGEETSMASSKRIFSKIFLLINVLAILIATFYLMKLWLKTKSPVILFVAVLLFAAFVQSLVIIPEQRYLQGVLCVFWLFCLMFINNIRLTDTLPR